MIMILSLSLSLSLSLARSLSDVEGDDCVTAVDLQTHLLW